jgi:hypothetical protein
MVCFSFCTGIFEKTAPCFQRGLSFLGVPGAPRFYPSLGKEGEQGKIKRMILAGIRVGRLDVFFYL